MGRNVRQRLALKIFFLGVLIALTAGIFAYRSFGQQWGTLVPPVPQAAAAGFSGIDFYPSDRDAAEVFTLFEHIYPHDPNDTITIPPHTTCVLNDDATANTCVPRPDIVYRLGTFTQKPGDVGQQFLLELASPHKQILDNRASTIRLTLSGLAEDKYVNLIIRWFLEERGQTSVFKAGETSYQIGDESFEAAGSYSPEEIRLGFAGLSRVESATIAFHEILHYLFDKMDARVEKLQSAHVEAEKVENTEYYDLVHNAAHNTIQALEDRLQLIYSVRTHKVKLTELFRATGLRIVRSGGSSLRKQLSDLIKNDNMGELRNIFDSPDGFDRFYFPYVQNAASKVPVDFVGYSPREVGKFKEDVEHLHGYTAAYYWQAFRLALAFIDNKCGAAQKCFAKDKAPDRVVQIEEVMSANEPGSSLNFDSYFNVFVKKFSDTMVEKPLENGNPRSMAKTAYDLMSEQINLMKSKCAL